MVSGSNAVYVMYKKTPMIAHRRPLLYINDHLLLVVYAGAVALSCCGISLNRRIVLKELLSL